MRVLIVASVSLADYDGTNLVRLRELAPKPDEKVCGRCLCVRKKAEFNRDRRLRDGLQGECRRCRHERRMNDKAKMLEGVSAAEHR